MSAPSASTMTGSQRRVFEAMVERLMAGETAKSVAADFPDEYGYGPVLDGIEKLRKAALEFLEGGYAVHLGNCSYGSWNDRLTSCDCKLFARSRRLAKVLGVKSELEK